MTRTCLYIRQGTVPSVLSTVTKLSLDLKGVHSSVHSTRRAAYGISAYDLCQSTIHDSTAWRLAMRVEDSWPSLRDQRVQPFGDMLATYLFAVAIPYSASPLLVSFDVNLAHLNR